jgi:hypothetical protein
MKNCTGRSAIVVCFLLILAPFAGMAGEPKRDPKQLAQFLVNGYKAKRSSLQTGAFRAHGTKFYKFDAEQLIYEIEIFSAFDIPKSLLRFDQLQTEKPRSGAAAKKSDEDGGKFARTPKLSLFWHRGGAVLVERADEKLPPWVQPFDARCVGLMTMGSFSGEIDFNDICSHLDKSSYIEAAEEKPGLYRLSWLSPSAVVQTTVWLDEKRGFSPTRTELRAVDEIDGKKTVAELLEISASTYIEISGVWVPRSFRLQRANENSLGFQVCEVAFDWDAVNQAIDEKTFTIEGLNMPRGSVVIDGRLPKPIILGLTGDVPFPSPAEDVDLPPASSNRWIAAIGGGTALLLVSFALLCGYRRWGRQLPAVQ